MTGPEVLTPLSAALSLHYKAESYVVNKRPHVTFHVVTELCTTARSYSSTANEHHIFLHFFRIAMHLVNAHIFLPYNSCWKYSDTIRSFLAVIIDEATVGWKVMVVRTGRKRLSETYMSTVYTGNRRRISTSHYQINIFQVCTLLQLLRLFYCILRSQYDYSKKKRSTIHTSYNKNSFIRW